MSSDLCLEDGEDPEELIDELECGEEVRFAQVCLFFLIAFTTFPRSSPDQGDVNDLQFRRIDGRCNNLRSPLWGAAG